MDPSRPAIENAAVIRERSQMTSLCRGGLASDDAKESFVRKHKATDSVVFVGGSGALRYRTMTRGVGCQDRRKRNDIICELMS